MIEQYDLATLAKALSFEERKRRLMRLDESDLRLYISRLLEKAKPDSVVEITHGAEELGKDLVVVEKGVFGKEVTGIVVKTGVIGGKTMGKVAEIADQVEQCFDHPARLKTITEPLKISRVWIMAAGPFTSKGHIRLQAKLAKISSAIQIFDITWLAEQFTTFYPQVFFEGAVIEFINEKILELESKKMISRCAINLSDAWVDPLVAGIDEVIGLDEHSITLVFEQKRLPFSNLKTLALQVGKKIVLAGDPGTGKSTALAKMTLDLFKDAFNVIAKGKLKETEIIQIPILTSARDVLHAQSTEAFINEQFSDCPARERFSVSILLIDSLDEVSHKERLSVIDKASQIGQSLNCNVLVASRKVEAIKEPIPGYDRFELLSFDLSRAINLMGKLVRDSELLKILRDGLTKIQFQILMTPLSLSLLIDIAENYREIPASLTELYDRFTDIALGRFDKEKGIDVLFEYEVKKRFLAELAYTEFLQKNNLDIQKTDFALFVSNYSQRYSWDREKLNDFVREIERAGILTISDVVSFCHRSFLDYFAAYHIYVGQGRIGKDRLDDMIRKLYFSDVWGDVAFFFIGLNREINEETIDKIVSYDREGLIYDIDRFLVGRLLQAGWHSTSEVKISTLRRLLTFAPRIRKTVVEAAAQKKPGFPEIFGDFLILALCEIGLVSGFIEKEERLLFNELSSNRDSQSLYSSLLILRAIRKFCSTEELRGLIDSILDAMPETKSLTPEDQARLLVLCSNIEIDDPDVKKYIKRKILRIWEKHPGIRQRLLPQPKKGFRRKSK